MLSVGQVLLVLVAGHLLNTFLLWLTHFVLHQRILGIPLYQIHLGAHHRIDHENEYVLDVSTVYEHMVWGAFTLAASLAYLALLPLWIAIILIAELLLLAATVYYIHELYERPAVSKLERFKWYRHGKALHRIHHSYRPETDPTVSKQQHQGFRRSVNYSFGGLFTGALMDRVFRTYLKATPKSV